MRQGKFEDWFEKNQEFINQVPPNEIWDSLEAKRNKHIELWKSGTVKYTLSRRSLNVPDLLKAGVNCRFVNCNQDDILKSSELLMHDSESEEKPPCGDRYQALSKYRRKQAENPKVPDVIQ